MNRRGEEKRAAGRRNSTDTLEIWKEARERHAQKPGELTVNLQAPGGARGKEEKKNLFDCCLKEGYFQYISHLIEAAVSPASRRHELPRGESQMSLCSHMGKCCIFLTSLLSSSSLTRFWRSSVTANCSDLGAEGLPFSRSPHCPQAWLCYEDGRCACNGSVWRGGDDPG